MFGKIDHSLAFFDNMGTDIKEMAKKSIESLPILSQRFNRLHIEGGEQDEFDQVFNSHRFIYITAEALVDNC